MKTNKGAWRRAGIITALAVLLVSVAHAQNALQFTGAKPTAEGAVLLYWASNTNEVYEVDYATEFNTNWDGTTVWQPLYTDYPSHGNSTFIADDGNYYTDPEVPHPKFFPKRFYRVMLVQNNDAPSNPTVAITSPSNGATLSGLVTVSVSSSTSDILSEVKLYVDGEEQWATGDGTNFLVNTCEWLNGPHILFATAKSQSGLEGVANGGPIYFGRSVSSYVNVGFSNLISHVEFSQRFFEPALGQTQQVTATFAANVNWTLKIQDANSNTVRTVTGSGTSMSFNWDGTGDGGVGIPDGAYSYLISAQTNGNSFLMDGGSLLQSSAMSTSFTDSTSTDWYPTTLQQAIAAGWSFYYVKPPPMPPVRSNGVWVPWEDVYGPHPLIQVQVPTSTQTMTAGAATLDSPQSDAAAYSGPGSQGTRAPERKPRVGVKGEAGSYGICYRTYGTNGFGSQHPLTGWPYPLPTLVAIDGQSRTAITADYSVPSFKPFAENFASLMDKGGWKQAFLKSDNQWGANDIKKTSLGGNSIFNTCNFGMLMTHGSFGNSGSTGNEADGVKYTYIWVGPNNYVRLTDMDFGSSGTNGLRWMTIAACNMLQIDCLNSMLNAGKTPVNDNLHLLMGMATVAYANTRFGTYYASNLLANLTIPTAWYNAGSKSYHQSRGVTNSVVFRVMGNGACANDTLSQYSDPDPSQDGYMDDQLVFDINNP